MGDFNMRDVKWQFIDDSDYLVPSQVPVNDTLGFNEFLSKMQLLALKQMVHIPNDAGNFLDLVFTRHDSNIAIFHAPVTLTNIKQTDSPHPPIEIEINITSLVRNDNAGEKFNEFN